MKKYLSEVVLLVKCFDSRDLEQWLYWNLNVLCFDHCHIFDNESIIDIQPYIAKYGDKISYERVTGWPDQFRLYTKRAAESPAWWMMPIDDDEYLYISDKYDHKINNYLMDYIAKKPDVTKLSFRWQNMFPSTAIDRRDYPMWKNTSYCNDALSKVASRVDDHWVKTIVCLTNQINYLYDLNGVNTKRNCHNPLVNGKPAASLMPNWQQCHGERIEHYTPNNVAILFHYNFKSRDEWNRKMTKNWDVATKRSYGSVLGISWYDKLFDQKQRFHTDNRIKEIMESRDDIPNF